MIQLLRNSLVLIGMLLAICSNAQQFTFPTDVQANGIGYASTAWTHDATANSNPASLAFNSGTHVNAGVRNRFLIDELYDFGLFTSIALGSQGSVGIQVEHFGFEQFRQQSFAGAYGRYLSDQWSLGVRFRYLLITQDEQDNASSVEGSIGLQYQLNDELTFGIEVNPFRSKFNDVVVLQGGQKIGLSYQPSDLVTVNGDLRYYRDIDQPWSIGIGVTYDVLESVNLMLGFRSNPDAFSFGVGLQVSEGLKLQISSSFHQTLGVSPMGGFRYSSID